MGLLTIVRKMATDWVAKASLMDLIGILPSEVLEGGETKKASIPTEPVVVSTDDSGVVKAAVAKVIRKPRRRVVPKKAGILTAEKRDEILKRVGSLPLGSIEYNSVRDQICKDLDLSRRQVSKFIDETRKLANGTSSLTKARAAKKAAKGKGKTKK